MALDVLFVDLLRSPPYDPRVLVEGSVGGAEASVVRVAEGLGRFGLSVAVCHAGRSLVERFDAAYLPIRESRRLRPANVVLVRDAARLRALRRRFAPARLHLWVHDLITGGTSWKPLFRDPIYQTNATVVVPSQFSLGLLGESAWV